MKLFCIVDVKSGLALRAGHVPDGCVHQAAPTSDPFALWILEPSDEPNAYYLRDALHGKYISAPETYDGRVVHSDSRTGDEAKWALFPMYEGPGGDLAVTIKDCKHSRALVAGDPPDGTIYHEEPNGRMNAFWTLVAVGERP